MKIGWSGVGNMSSAIIRGLLASPVSQNYSLHAYTRSGPQSDNAMHQKLQWHKSNKELAAAVDILVLGVKPYVIADVLQDIQDLEKLPLIVSLAAGTTTASMLQELPSKQNIGLVRVMPNTPSQIGEGMTGLYANKYVSDAQRDNITEIFQSVGQILWLDTEESFHGLTAISGSGPAYYFMFTQALIDAGVAQGLSLQQASQLAIQTAKGASLLMANSEHDPRTLQKEVTSPNGTTHAATQTLAQEGLNECVAHAVDAAAQRSKELSESG